MKDIAIIVTKLHFPYQRDCEQMRALSRLSQVIGLRNSWFGNADKEFVLSFRVFQHIPSHVYLSQIAMQWGNNSCKR